MVLDLLGPYESIGEQYNTGNVPSWGSTILEDMGGPLNPDLGVQQWLPGGSDDGPRLEA